METQKILYFWDRKRLWLTLFLYWLLTATSSCFLEFFTIPVERVWHLNTLILLILVILCMITERNSWPTWKRIVFVPLSLIIHAILTIPSAMTLGVLMYSPDHVRTQGEHRAIFFLSSLPVLLYAMWRSRLFVRSTEVTVFTEKKN